MTKKPKTKMDEMAFKINSVLTGRSNWVPKESPVIEFSDGFINIRLPKNSAHMHFDGEYSRPIAFPLLRQFHGCGIDAIIEAELTELTPDALDYWTRWKKDNPRSAMIMNSDRFWNTILKDIFVTEEEFLNHPVFQVGINKYGDNCYKHQPGFVALHIYADPQQLLDTYSGQGISVWSVEKRDRFLKESDELKSALFSNDVGRIKTFLANNLLSFGSQFKVSPKDIDTISQEMATTIVFNSSNNNTDKAKH